MSEWLNIHVWYSRSYRPLKSNATGSPYRLTIRPLTLNSSFSSTRNPSRRLREIGEWLDLNGEAIYGSHYWVVSEDKTGDVAVRYTTHGEYVYAVMFGWPDGIVSLSIPAHITPSENITVDLLGRSTDFDCEVGADELRIDLPEFPPVDGHAWTLRVQVVKEGADAFKSADPPSEDEIIRSAATLRTMVDGDYEEETWSVEE